MDVKRAEKASKNYMNVDEEEVTNDDIKDDIFGPGYMGWSKVIEIDTADDPTKNTIDTYKRMVEDNNF